ncbi:hypothetical protein [Roseimicrobium sp. ORNL1]|uniref:hypothetical protein n=1 Tax=Roseimicrobium sp. ORNL1 TaxID=2711231 RepID=UPI0013E17F15|nr:hypothetical protein [Roseimicrobium sp. ORNL1]QIF03714.1 hypothetical protein G5S37_20045 [Roseimicrobium sp. ORNL1]
MRIRTIKPDFWHHEGMAALPAETRLLAIALLNWADDEGYFLAAAALIKGNLFPFTEASPDVPSMFAELCRVGWMQLGTDTEGRKVGRIINFSKHQCVNKPRASRLKDTSTFSLPLPDASMKAPVPFPEASMEEGNGRGIGTGSGVGNGTGTGNGMEEAAPAATPPPTFAAATTAAAALTPAAQALPSTGMSGSKSMSMNAIGCDGKYPTMEQALAYAQGAPIPITPAQATAWHESRSDNGWMTSVRGTLTPIADWRANLHSFVRIWNTRDADKKAKEEERLRRQREKSGQGKRPGAGHAPGREHEEEHEQEQACEEASSPDTPSPPGRAELSMHERFAHFTRMQELDREWEASPHPADELPPSQRPENQIQ